MKSFTLRPAAPHDDHLQFALFASARAGEVEPLPVDAELKRTFLQILFAAQCQHFRAQFPQAEYLLIEQEGAAVGRLVLDQRDDRLHILDLILLPRCRANGLEDLILQAMLDQAAAAGKHTSLYVEDFNPARTRFEGLGFQPIDAHGLYLLLSKAPAS
jgi:GNAT superfamily N-acetyltransferase